MGHDRSLITCHEDNGFPKVDKLKKHLHVSCLFPRLSFFDSHSLCKMGPELFSLFFMPNFMKGFLNATQSDEWETPSTIFGFKVEF